MENLVTSEDHGEHFDENTRMFDIQDSPAYKAQEIGLKRVVDEDGTVCDIEESPDSHQRLESCEIGLGMTINLDWRDIAFNLIVLMLTISSTRLGITDRRPHSAGGVYVSFNRLHRRVRLLGHNIHLVMVLSGEPSLEDLNNVFAAFKIEMELLYIGKTFPK